MRQSWTDERLDDFRQDVDKRFDAVDQRFDAVDRRFDAVDQRFAEVNRRMDAGFARVGAELGDLNGRIDGLQQTLIKFGFAMVVGLLGVLTAMVGVIATQL